MQGLNEGNLREFYEYIFPVDLVAKWLSYNIAQDANSSSGNNVSGAADAMAAAVPSETEKMKVPAAVSSTATSSYLARREFCFTLLGDIFTRFRSYSSAAELKTELLRCYPEKIDAGAVYNIRPNQKQGVAEVLAVERELVFDIDMSDYDNVRSCCSGKSICAYCWAWMSCAAHVLHTVLMEDFGFKYILPVFSGRRGIHLWVCDRRARLMHDDERSALVGYLTVVVPKTLRSSIVADLANHRPIHPTIRHLLYHIVEKSFAALFVTSPADNPNNVQSNPPAAAVVHDAVLTVLKMGRRDQLNRFLQHLTYHEGQVLDWVTFTNALGSPSEARDTLNGAQLLLMYPRLDEHVSTKRNHLLKLPFCVHPGTSSLCCPLEWDTLSTFDPLNDPPKLDAMLLERHMDSKWLTPLRRMLREMGQDPEEAM